MKLATRNIQTNKTEVIKCTEPDKKDWGFSFFVESELDAYKAAYIYRDSKHGVKIDYAGGVGQWMVTVFNDVAAVIGIDGAKS